MDKYVYLVCCMHKYVYLVFYMHKYTYFLEYLIFYGHDYVYFEDKVQNCLDRLIPYGTHEMIKGLMI